jgi:hypothetical protein
MALLSISLSARNPITLDQILEFDYMGSSEFEGGALRESLTRIKANKDIYDYFDVPVNCNLMTIFAPKNRIEEVKKAIVRLAHNEFKLLEPSYFDTYIFPPTNVKNASSSIINKTDF